MSTGTNRERIEQNNTKLSEIKNKVSTLPDYKGDVKQFATVEAMQADTTAKEGDLAVVYRSEVQNATVDSKFQVATFPDTVVLDTAITDRVEVRYRAVDSSKMFDCWGQLNNTSFRMDCYSETGEIRIQYTSSDGITYTRTDSTGNPVDFGTEIYYEMPERWNDAIGKFIQIGGNKFEGLYKYSPYTNGDIYAISRDDVSIVEDKVTITASNSVIAERELMEKAINKLRETISYTKKTLDVNITMNAAKTKLTLYTTLGESAISYYVFYNNKIYVHAYTATDNISAYEYNITSNTITFLRNGYDTTITIGSTAYNCMEITDYYLLSRWDYNANYVESGSEEYYVLSCANYGQFEYVVGTTRKNLISNLDTYLSYTVYYDYSIAPTQLNTTPDYVYEKEFYGKNGAELGTLTQNVSNQFTDMNAEVYSKIQQQYDKLEPRVLTDSDKTIDKNISVIPIKSDGTPLLDTSKVTNMNIMFQNCTNLTTVPQLNTSSATTMFGMFSICTNLTTVPLLDTSSVTNMNSMFQSCTSLTTIPLLNTSKVTNMFGMFMDCKNLTTIPLLDTGSVTSMQNMFVDCANLTTIPQLATSNVTNMCYMFDGCTSLTTIPLLNTSKVTNMQYMFNGCTSLTTIPLLDTGSVTNMQNMFVDCTSLSDESLNNILTMCANATSYTNTKTLKYIGLTSEQATKCTTLSNYSAFTSAGWTTGY